MKLLITGLLLLTTLAATSADYVLSFNRYYGARAGWNARIIEPPLTIQFPSQTGAETYARLDATNKCNEAGISTTNIIVDVYGAVWVYPNNLPLYSWHVTPLVP